MVGYASIISKKYHGYCKTRDLQDNIFKMEKKEEEGLGSYVEIF